MTITKTQIARTSLLILGLFSIFVGWRQFNPLDTYSQWYVLLILIGLILILASFAFRSRSSRVEGHTSSLRSAKNLFTILIVLGLLYGAYVAFSAQLIGNTCSQAGLGCIFLPGIVFFPFILLALVGLIVLGWMAIVTVIYFIKKSRGTSSYDEAYLSDLRSAWMRVGQFMMILFLGWALVFFIFGV